MRLVAALSFLAFLLSPVMAQQPAGRKEFPPGTIRRSQDLPQSRLRDQIDRLPVQARNHAVAQLGKFHFAHEDLKSLHVDASGAIFYADTFELPPREQQAATEEDEPQVAQAAVPINPFPSDIIFHSRMGAPNVLYLDFTGETITGTAWNDSVGRLSIPAVAFSTDSDLTTFSDAERLAIKRIWQRVAEDYAPFNIDVTTERPPSFNTRTAHALITRNTDANGEENPASTSGGVAYVGVFGTTTYARYRPAWIYSSNLGGEESYIAEAISHEVGHNFGLSHDGTTDGSDYYGGHGSGDTSWGPLMGTGYNRNVSQWSKGEYYRANNTQDDLATIASKLTYRVDDHGDSSSASSSLSVSNDGSITSTTPETDAHNFFTANKGIIERSTDVDMFSFTTGTGAITLRVNPWVVASGRTRGGNVDLIAQLYNASGQLLLTANVTTTTVAVIQTNLLSGVYYLAVRTTGAGFPTDSTPTGYSVYGSIGQYFISGSVAPAGPPIPPAAELTVIDITEPGVSTKIFTVRYSDNVAIDVSSIGNNDVRVTGPNGYSRTATLVSVDQNSNGTPRTATYRVDPPGSAWQKTDDGTYSVSMLASSAADTEGAFVPASALGTFRV
ncbi:MAG: zinc-dependent metalloprotease family protein, partial [Limisphaerales bacterium]